MALTSFLWVPALCVVIYGVVCVAFAVLASFAATLGTIFMVVVLTLFALAVFE